MSRNVPMISYIPREIRSIITQSSKRFPAIALTGPRQSGKATLLQNFVQGLFTGLQIQPRIIVSLVDETIPLATNVTTLSIEYS